MISFGKSGLPPEGVSDSDFLDGLVAAGHSSYELAFTKDFPWKEKRCEAFGSAAAERGIEVSLHAPYFAILTVEDEDRSKQCLAALEHSMKLGRALGARIICAHIGHVGERTPSELMELVSARLGSITKKVEGLGVGLGLETSGHERNFGSLGDIAELAARFSYVRPLVDWAHIHARTGGALVTKEAFESVLAFVVESFPGWMIDPLQCQFSDNLVGPGGEVKHLPYGEGTLRVGPLVRAVREAGIGMRLISESRDEESHRAIQSELEEAMAEAISEPPGRPVHRGAIVFPDEVRAIRDGDNWVFGSPLRTLKLSNLDKRFFPDGTTKGDLIQYYASIAPVLLPHLADRPLSMSRYPDGIEGGSFYEKRAPGHRPDWLGTAAVVSDSMGGAIDFVAANDRESLMWLANMGCIEVHPFHSRTDSPEFPDYAIFDLDPAEGSHWEQVVAGADLIRVALAGLGLRGYPKLSGSKGMHVYVPVEPVYPYSRVRGFVEAVGRLLVAANPDDLTMEWDIPARRGKVFIDHNRNASGQTIASVYSVRPRPGAPVSVPLQWSEVAGAKNGDFTIANLWDRLQRHGDLFAPVLQGGQRLEGAEEALGLQA